MADQHNANIPAVGNQISSDIPDIKENLEWHKDLLQMIVGWKASTIASVGPPNHRAQFTHGDDDTLTIGVGSYFHDGTVRQTVFWDAAITFDLGSGGSNALSDDLGASEWHYIYLDDSAIVTQADTELDADCFLNDTTAPTWSDAKHGWYNGADRCIFAVLTDATNDLIAFYHDGGDLILWDAAIETITAQDVDTSWVDISTALMIPGFSTKAQIFARMNVRTTNDMQVDWRVNGSTDATGHPLFLCGTAASNMPSVHLPVMTDSSQLIELKCGASSTDTLAIDTEGWYLPAGM